MCKIEKSEIKSEIKNLTLSEKLLDEKSEFKMFVFQFCDYN